MSVLQTFAPEHRTPPLPLIALIGCQEYHKDVADFFVQQLRPPLVSLNSSEPVEQFVPRVFGGHGRHAALRSQSSTSHSGILKADWFGKHRGKRPAVALVFVNRSEVEGDPSTWNRLLYKLKLVKDATEPLGAGMVVAVVQDPAAGDLPFERITAISHNLSIDPRMLCAVSARLGISHDAASRGHREAALKNLGALVHDQCSAYYQRRAKHVSDKLAERQAAYADRRCPPDIMARASLKLAVYAEFRQDWRRAASEYAAAYAHVRSIAAGSSGDAAAGALAPSPSLRTSSSGSSMGPLGLAAASAAAASGSGAYQQRPASAPPPSAPLPPARWAEVCKVCELVQLKLLMLLTYQQRLEEAVAQAAGHLAFFATPPGPALPPAAAAAHLGFMVRQYQLTAEVLSPKLEGSPLGAAAKECSRATLLMAAAQAAVARRRLLESLRAARAASPLPPLDLGSVRRGVWLGQVALRADGAAAGAGSPHMARPLTDAEYVLYLEAEEGRAGGGGASGAAGAVLDVINGALAALRDARHAERTRGRLGALMAGEHAGASNLSAARKLLLQVAHTLRREGWEALLAQVLLLLRDVAQRLRLPGEHITHSLELSVVLAGHARLGAAATAGASSSQLAPALLPLPYGISAQQQQAGGPGGMPDPAAMCRAAVSALLSGVSDVGAKSAFAKSAAGSASTLDALTDGPTPTPTSSSSSHSSTASSTAHHAHASTASSATSAAAPQHHRSFAYSVQHLDLREAQRRAREGGGGEGEGGRGGGGGAATVADLLQRHYQQDFGWWRVLGLSVGWSRPSAPDPHHLDCYCAVRSELSCALPVRGVTLTFADDLEGEWSVVARAAPLPADCAPAQPGEPLEALLPMAGPPAAWQQQSQPHHTSGLQHRSSGSASCMQGASRGGGWGGDEAESGGPGVLQQPQLPYAFSLEPGRWHRVGARVTPRCVGRLRLERVTLSIGDHCTLAFNVASFPQGQVTLGGLHERVWGRDDCAPFRARGMPGVAAGTATAVVQHVGPLPRLKLWSLPSAYVGEWCLVAAAVTVCAPLPQSVLELAVRPGPGGGLAPGDVNILVDDRGHLERYNGSDAARVQLPSIPAGGSHTVRAWLQCRAAGGLTLGAVLQCPAPVSGTVEVAVEEPFEHKVSLSSEAGVHLLTPPKLGTPAAARGGPPPPPPSPAAASDLGLTHLTPGQRTLMTTRVRALGAGGGGGGGAADCALELVDVQVVPEASTGISVVSELRHQLSGWPVALSRGDVQSLVLTLLPTRVSEGGVGLGRLHLHWRRPAPAALPEATTDAAGGAGASGASAEKEAAGGKAQPRPPEELLTPSSLAALRQQEPRPDDLVVTPLDLPRVCVADSLLLVRVAGPDKATVTAGIAFTYTLHYQSFAPTPLDLAIALQDAPGLVCSGDRAQSVHVGPREAGTCCWLLVAHAPGHLALPAVRVAVPKHSAQLTTQSPQVYVLPF